MGGALLPPSWLFVWGDLGEPTFPRLNGRAVGDTQEDLGQHAPPKTVAASAHGCSLVSPYLPWLVTITVCAYMSLLFSKGKTKSWVILEFRILHSYPWYWLRDECPRKFGGYLQTICFKTWSFPSFIVPRVKPLQYLCESCTWYDTTKNTSIKLFSVAELSSSLSKTEKSHWKLKVSWPLRTTLVSGEKSGFKIPCPATY